MIPRKRQVDVGIKGDRGGFGMKRNRICMWEGDDRNLSFSTSILETRYDTGTHVDSAKGTSRAT